MKALRAIGALVVLAALLVGVPWLLVAIGSPGYLLEANWSTALFVHADSRIWLAVLSLVGWVAWFALALALAFEVLAVVSRQRIRLVMPGLGWLQPTLGALILALLTSPAAASPTDSPVPDEAVLPVATAESAPARVPEATATPQSTRSHVVAPGDELWTIAERELGSGERWREIAALNDLSGPRIEPGQLLRLPEVEPTGTVQVQEGDSLWSIAEAELGDPHRWGEIHELNQQQVPQPDQLQVGMRLALPTEPQIAEPPEPETMAEPVAEPPKPETVAEPVVEPPLNVEEVQNAPESESVASVAEPSDADASAVSAALWAASIGSVLAAGVVAILAGRRRAQLQSRPVGRRVPSLAEGARFLTGLARAAEPAGKAPPGGTLLGWTAENKPVTLDLEAARMTILQGDGAAGALTALVTTLLCSDTTSVVLPGGKDWAEAFDEPRVSAPADTAAGLAELEQLCARRRIALRSTSLAEVRANPDLAESWQSVVFVFQEPLSAEQTQAAVAALDFGAVGVSVAMTSSEVPANATVVSLSADGAELNGQAFVPQSLPEPARRALIDLLATTGSTATESAPWWNAQLPANVRPLARPNQDLEEAPMPPDSPHPRLLLLGEVELLGAAGTRPTRAVQQCLEYCAWLLQHPGSTPTAMLRDLVVAETTRRSNMSRLRTWLGHAADGAQYLPDAYCGRIKLDPRVDSDWDRLRALTAGGVNLASTPALVEALSLVRGVPLGTKGFLWSWAEQLRTDMMSPVVDAACVLADRAITAGDPQQALWAVGQAKLLGEVSDELAAREIHALALAGRREELDSAVMRLSRETRGAGRDLDPQLARRVQFALQHVGDSARHGNKSAPPSEGLATPPRRAQ